MNDWAAIEAHQITLRKALAPRVPRASFLHAVVYLYGMVLWRTILWVPTYLGVQAFGGEMGERQLTDRHIKQLPLMAHVFSDTWTLVRDCSARQLGLTEPDEDAPEDGASD